MNFDIRLVPDVVEILRYIIVEVVDWTDYKPRDTILKSILDDSASGHV